MLETRLPFRQKCSVWKNPSLLKKTVLPEMPSVLGHVFIQNRYNVVIYAFSVDR